MSFLAALLLAPFAVAPLPWVGAADAPSPSLLFHPDGPGEKRLAIGLGVTADLQRYSTDSGFIPVLPVFDIGLRYGLPRGLFAAAELHTLFIVNDATVGAGWVVSPRRAPRLSFMARFMGGVQVGWLVGSGFKTATISPIFKPSLAIGFKAHDGLRWTLREQFLFTYWQLVDNGGYWTDNKPRQANIFSGAETQLTLENLLDRGGNVYFGIGAIFARPSVTLWIPFLQQQALDFYPRIFGGYVF